MDGHAAGFRERLQASASRVVLMDGSVASPAELKVERVWQKDLCRSRLHNVGQKPVRVAWVGLFDFAHSLPAETPVYGEGFQMLAQTGGTLGSPKDWGSYPDRTHYRLDEPDALRTVHGVMLLHPNQAEHILLGFGSCRRFDGRVSFDAKRILVSFDCEGLELLPGQSWELEEFVTAAGPQRESLLDLLCRRVEANHPRRTLFRQPPTGWCSWYCFGPKVTADDIRRNLDWIATNAPALRYIQIDDGYQPWMGDWLETGKSFGGVVRSVLKQIRARGFEPAIWVAPFVASPQSELFRRHPDWFMQDEQRKPLRSDQVGFGGWRQAPWYALDATHPEAEQFLENLFRTMRTEWGCTYFKLDAIYWGALHRARLHDPRATRIEAYRRGMAAIARGAGDSFILGCNHPIWPSLGLIDGARSSMDISRNWASVRDIGRQNLLRGWQNGRFWWNDPDCLLLSGGKGLSESEVRFHAATVSATGGMLLSGDDLPKLEPAQAQVLRKLLPPTGVAAGFADEQLAVGRMPLNGKELIYLFNWGNAPLEREVRFSVPTKLKDYWTGEVLGVSKEFRSPALPAHAARVIIAEPAAGR